MIHKKRFLDDIDNLWLLVKVLIVGLLLLPFGIGIFLILWVIIMVIINPRLKKST